MPNPARWRTGARDQKNEQQTLAQSVWWSTRQEAYVWQNGMNATQQHPSMLKWYQQVHDDSIADEFDNCNADNVSRAMKS